MSEEQVELIASGFGIIVRVDGKARGRVWWNYEREAWIAEDMGDRALGESPLRTRAIEIARDAPLTGRSATYPRWSDDHRRYEWACCESTIGPVCHHLAMPKD
jgi:hypothetical protein